MKSNTTMIYCLETESKLKNCPTLRTIRAGCFLGLSVFLLSTNVRAQTPNSAPASVNTPQTIQILTGWKSASERKALDVLTGRLAKESVIWKDVVIANVSADAGLMQTGRVKAGSTADMARLAGPLISAWFNRGLIDEFKPLPLPPGADKASLSGNLSGKWDKAVFPTVEEWVRPNGHLLAIPLGIHRLNLIFYNRQVFEKYKLKPPQNWEEFVVVSNKLQREGIIPLAQSSEPWQVASLFESLLLSESTPDFYRRALVKKDPAAFSDTRFVRALLRMRILKKFMPSPVKDLDWTYAARLVASGDAGMVIMGDFAKGELNAWGYTTDVNFGCIAVPNTANDHLYQIDTLVVQKKDHPQAELVDKIAQLLVSSNLQADYNIAKGSVSVLRTADQIKMDSCARNSWKVFDRGSAAQVPSMVQDMTADSDSRDAIITELSQYFLDDRISVTQITRRLAAIARLSSKSR